MVWWDGGMLATLLHSVYHYGMQAMGVSAILLRYCIVLLHTSPIHYI